MIAQFILVSILTFLQAQDPVDLIGKLASDDIEERDHAATQLVELGVVALKPVERACSSDDAEVAGRAREVLRRFPGIVRMEHLYEVGFRRTVVHDHPTLPDALWSDDPAEQVKGIKILAGLIKRGGSPQKTAPRTASSLSDLKVLFQVRPAMLTDSARAVLRESLLVHRSRELLPYVIPLLAHSTPAMRHRTAQVLAEAGIKEAAPYIAQILLKREDVHSGWSALKKLDVAPPPSLLRKLMRSPDELIRHHGALAAGHFQVKGLTSEMVLALESIKASHLRWPIVVQLRWRPAPQEVLTPLFESPRHPNRLDALKLALHWRSANLLDRTITLLGDPHPSVRKAALEAIPGLRDPKVPERLMESDAPQGLLALGLLDYKGAIPKARSSLGHSDPEMRLAAVTTLRRLDAHQAAHDITVLLGDTESRVRAEAARVLPHLAGDSMEDRLITSFTGEIDPTVRAALIRALGEIGSKRGKEITIAHLKDETAVVAGAAAEVAATLGLLEAAPVIVGHLFAKDTKKWKYQIENALRILKPKNLVELLRPHLESKDAEVRKRAYYLLFLAPSGAEKWILRGLSDPDVQQNAVYRVRHTMKKAGPILTELIGSDKDKRLGTEAGEAIVRVGYRPAIEKGMEWLKSSSYEIRQNGWKVLGDLNAVEKIPDLIRLLDSDDKFQRTSAWNALLGMDPAQTLPIFRCRVREGSPASRASAATFLSYRHDRESIPLIEPLLDSPDASARKSASSALAGLGATSSYGRIVEAMKKAPESDLSSYLWAIRKTGEDRAYPLLKSFLSAENEKVRKSALRQLAYSNGPAPDLWDAVEPFVSDKDTSADAWKALMRLDPQRGLETLKRRISRGDSVPTAWISELIGRIAPSELAPIAVHGLNQAPYWDDLSRIRALARIGDKHVVPSLLRVLHDEDPRKRLYAAAALAELGEESSAPVILADRRFRPTSDWGVSRAYFCLNRLRNPRAFARLKGITWSLEWEGRRTLEHILERFGRSTGFSIAFSQGADSRRISSAPKVYPRDEAGTEYLMDEIWRQGLVCIIEEREIRVVTWPEAIRFWEGWITEQNR